MHVPSDDSLVCRGITIAIQVQSAEDGVFGHADLYEEREFRARVAIGSARADPSALRRRLRWLAKSKVDVWSLAAGA